MNEESAKFIIAQIAEEASAANVTDCKNMIRISVDGGGCSGLNYGMYLEDEINEDDHTEEHYGVTVVIDKISCNYLVGATVNLVGTDVNEGLQIDNPNNESGCGCSSGGCGGCGNG